MLTYIAIFTILWLLAFFEARDRVSRLWPTLALLIVLGFAAFRFETGFDWIVYDAAFNRLPDFIDAIRFGVSKLNPPMEPLYVWLNIVIKSLTTHATVLFAIIALFSIISIHSVVGIISRSQCVVWLVYFGLAFLAVEMSAMRMAVAVSLVLIGLLCAARDRPVMGALVILFAAGFHFSAVAFLPIPLLRYWRPSIWLLGCIVAVGIIWLVLDIQILNQAIDLVSPHAPATVAEKLDSFYYNLKPAVVSPAALALVAGQCALLGVFGVARTKDEARDPYIIVAMWLTIFMLVAHLYFSGFPAIWNRIMYVALPWQVASLYRTQLFLTFDRGRNSLAIVGFGGVSLAALVYFLVSPASLPFIPYQTIVTVWLTGDTGTGLARSLAWYAEYDKSFVRRFNFKRNSPCPAGLTHILNRPYGHLDGYAYRAWMPALTKISDRDVNLYRSPVALCEDNKLIGPAHSTQAEVARSGLGQFSHYENTLVFSASDNSDPNSNGHEYTVVVPSRWADTVNFDCCACPEGKRLPLHGPYPSAGGYAVKAWLPALSTLADRDGALERSPIAVCEDNKLIGPAHSAQAEVARSGSGQFPHYENMLVFSASDKSDPNSNGHKYTVVVPSRWTDTVNFDCCACPEGKRLVLQRPYDHIDGFAYRVGEPSLIKIADTAGKFTRSPIELCEDEKLIGPAHSAYAEIVALGRGQFSHYDDWVIFSSSDHSDPNVNGRTYRIVVPAR